MDTAATPANEAPGDTSNDSQPTLAVDRGTRSSDDSSPSQPHFGMPLLDAAWGNNLANVEALLRGNAQDVRAAHKRTGFTALHIAASRGFVALVCTLLRTAHVSVDARDARQRTPLFYAAHRNNCQCAQALLDAGADASATDVQGWTPFAAAAAEGQLEAVKLLVTVHGVDPNARNNTGRTPLAAAAVRGHLPVICFLYEELGCDPTTPTYEECTPLLVAAHQGHADCVRYLASLPDASVTRCNGKGASPLYCAAARGHLEVVRCLVADLRVDIHKGDNAYHREPLLVAAFEGHPAVVELLLTVPGIDPGAADDKGWTPLMAACFNGHLQVVQALLADHRVCATQSCPKGITPFYAACFQGHLAIAKLLAPHADPYHLDKNNYSPLSAAASAGHLHVVEWLVADGVCRLPLLASTASVAPLMAAGTSGQADVVAFLLQQKVDASAGANGWTPLHAAVAWSRAAAVKQFLCHSFIDVNATNRFGFTPLLTACQTGHAEIVADLLKRQDLDVSQRLASGLTCVHVAALHGHVEVLRCLLTHEGIDPTAVDNRLNTVLHAACVRGHVEATTLLLTVPGVHIARMNVLNRNALGVACGHGCVQVVRVLLRHMASMSAPLAVAIANQPTRLGCTPFHSACVQGHAEVARVLLDSEHIPFDATRVDTNEWTPLHSAVRKDNLDVVKLLLHHDKAGGRTQLTAFVQTWLWLFANVGGAHSFVYRSSLPRNRGTLLHVACASRSAHVAKYLAAQPEVDRLARNADGYTPLRLAMLRSAVGCVQALLAFSDVRAAAVDDVREGLADLVAVSGRPFAYPPVPPVDNMSAQAQQEASHKVLSVLLQFKELVSVMPDALKQVDSESNTRAVRTIKAACRGARSWGAARTLLLLRYGSKNRGTVHKARVALSAARASQWAPAAQRAGKTSLQLTVSTVNGHVRARSVKATAPRRNPPRRAKRTRRGVGSA